MTTRILELELLGYWHPGTGQGDGVVADASVARASDGLPYLPGRTVKGLLRDAARRAASVGIDGLSPATITALFGSDVPPAGGASASGRVSRLEDARFSSKEGLLRIGSARLGRTASERDDWSGWARSPSGTPALRQLVRRVSSTALDEEGVAAAHTLRTIEVYVPMTLHARVEGPPDVPWAALDEAVRLFLDGVGVRRNRGLGRCTARLSEGGI